MALETTVSFEATIKEVRPFAGHEEKAVPLFARKKMEVRGVRAAQETRGAPHGHSLDQLVIGRKSFGPIPKEIFEGELFRPNGYYRPKGSFSADTTQNSPNFGQNCQLK